MAYKDKEKQNAWQRAYRKKNLDKARVRQATYYKKNPIIYLLCACRARCKKNGIPYNLTNEDIVIPTHCPVLGIPLIHGSKPFHSNSPSIDRIIPSLGYVKGNIAVISFRANRIKHDATWQEIRAVADWLEKQTCPSPSKS
jgi:hypothetical protein